MAAEEEEADQEEGGGGGHRAGDDGDGGEEEDWRYLTRMNPPRAARAKPIPNRRRRPPSLPTRPPRWGKCLGEGRDKKREMKQPRKLAV